MTDNTVKIVCPSCQGCGKLTFKHPLRRATHVETCDYCNGIGWIWATRWQDR